MDFEQALCRLARMGTFDAHCALWLLIFTRLMIFTRLCSALQLIPTGSCTSIPFSRQPRSRLLAGPCPMCLRRACMMLQSWLPAGLRQHPACTLILARMMNSHVASPTPLNMCGSLFCMC
jgi:hypothetical protein